MNLVLTRGEGVKNPRKIMEFSVKTENSQAEFTQISSLSLARPCKSAKDANHVAAQMQCEFCKVESHARIGSAPAPGESHPLLSICMLATPTGRGL